MDSLPLDADEPRELRVRDGRLIEVFRQFHGRIVSPIGIQIKQKNIPMGSFPPVTAAATMTTMGMEQRGTFPNGLARAMRRAEVGTSELARLLNTSRQNVARWKNQSRGLSPEWAGKIAPLLQTSAAELLLLEPDMRSEDVAHTLPDGPKPHTVPLKGYVGAGSEMHYYRLADEEYEEVPAPRKATKRTVAVEIRGKSMGPSVSGWLVFYDDVHSPVSEALHGRLCVVGLSDDRILIKRIQRQKNGLYTLLSNSDEPPIRDAKIEWAAPVTSLEPRG